jgi:uncharacterized SAM-binding protein YcdF (DUF218 family)
VGAVCLAAFFAVAYTPLTAALYVRHDERAALTRADAIVVLGAGMAPDGVLNAASLERLVSGIVLFRRGLAPRLVLLGPGHRAGPTEAEARAALARDLGVPADALVTEARGLTTREEAALVASRMREVGGRRVLLVTGTDHMPRARLLFEREGLDVIPAPVVEISPVTGQPDARLELGRILLQEALARVYYRVAGFL